MSCSCFRFVCIKNYFKIARDLKINFYEDVNTGNICLKHVLLVNIQNEIKTKIENLARVD